MKRINDVKNAYNIKNNPAIINCTPPLSRQILLYNESKCRNKMNITYKIVFMYVLT